MKKTKKGVIILGLSILIACALLIICIADPSNIAYSAAPIAEICALLTVAVFVIVILIFVLPEKKQIKELKQELALTRDRLTVSSDRMNEGLVITDKNHIIVSLNRRAMELLQTGTNCVGSDIRWVAKEFGANELFERAESGEHVEKSAEFGGLEYTLKVSSVVSNGEHSGFVLLILDTTERERSEKMRRDFTANVSHELKTPLHSILGCAELLCSGMVKPDDAEQFSGQIYSEAKRMVHLIDDIMNLSKLDEGAAAMQRSELDLYAQATQMVKSLESEAANAEVTLELTGESAIFEGIPQLINGIILNLCDNAIKYNRINGKVKINVSNEDGSAVLTVSDTGIGIPNEHRARVFERFYRVDKSHSKEVGGTGLGLSIVKHSARLHGAKIEMQSTYGEGTAITLRFPKSR